MHASARTLGIGGLGSDWIGLLGGSRLTLPCQGHGDARYAAKSVAGSVALPNVRVIVVEVLRLAMAMTMTKCRSPMLYTEGTLAILNHLLTLLFDRLACWGPKKIEPSRPTQASLGALRGPPQASWAPLPIDSAGGACAYT